MYQQATGSYSTAIAQHYQSENFYVHPLQFRNHNAVLENHSGSATMPRKKFDDFFSHLGTIPACDIQPSFDSKDHAIAHMRRVVEINDRFG